MARGDEIRLIRTRFEEIVRKATMELLAQEGDAQGDAQGDDADKYRWDDASYGNEPVWEIVAPFVDGVLNLMKMSEDASDVESKLDSSGAPNARPILIIMEMAEKHGFGYRQDTKEWDKFQALVPAVAGLLKDTNSRDLMRHSLSKVGPIKAKGFRGVGRGGLGFKQDSFESDSQSPSDPQSVYEEALPGELPDLESRNIKNILDLYSGDRELATKVDNALVRWSIVDYGSGKFSTDRLQSVLRYAMEKPDAPEAVAVVVGALVREAMRRGGFEDGTPKLDVGSDELLSGMQGATEDLLQRWMSMSMSILELVGKTPRGGYKSIKKEMARNAANIAIGIARKLLKAMVDSNQDQIIAETNAVRNLEAEAKGLWREAERQADLKQRGDFGQHMDAFNDLIGRMRDAVQDDDAKALRTAASGLFELAQKIIQPVLGKEPVEQFRSAVEELLTVASPARTAAKRLVSDIICQC